jgi:hypothetical protein
LTDKLQARIEKHYGITETLFGYYGVTTELERPLIEYARYVLTNGTEQERSSLAGGIKSRLELKNGLILIA